MARGTVPKPAYMEHYSARINAVAGMNCTEMAREIEGTAWHTEVGWFIATANFFDNPSNGALTDFQIGCEDDGQYNGVIMRFIEADQGVSPYANGRVGEVRPPFDEGAAFIAKWAQGNLEQVNARARSIELADAGNPDRDRVLTGPQIESLAFLTAYVHSEEAGQSWDAFAWNFLHYQTGTSHTGCPGQWLKKNKALVRARAADIMKAYQTNTKLARPLLITYPPGWTGSVIAQPGTTGGTPTVPTYPPGHDASTFAQIWASLGTAAAKAYPYNEKGVVSTLWREADDRSPLVWHFLDKNDGREKFVFASGLEIGRLNTADAFGITSKEAA